MTRIRLLLVIAMLALGSLTLFSSYPEGKMEPCPTTPAQPQPQDPEKLEQEYHRIAEELHKLKPISEIDIDIHPEGRVPPDQPWWN